MGSVACDKTGNVFGTTVGGGRFGDGTIWEITKSGLYVDIHDFGGLISYEDGQTGQDGINPRSGVSFDQLGNMFGTTALGGSVYSAGMIWEIDSNGSYIDLHNFGGMITSSSGLPTTDGAQPSAGVVIGADGNLYGTTESGGSGLSGIAWEIAGGAYHDIHDFVGTAMTSAGRIIPDGQEPIGDVAVDDIGNVFGTTSAGGTRSNGTVWKLRPDGAYGIIHDFTGTITNANGTKGPDGADPTAAITFDSAGNLFSTSDVGGAFGQGMLWEIAKNGAYRDVHDFHDPATGSDGTQLDEGVTPYTGVTFDVTGNAFGVCRDGGTQSGGQLWELPRLGPITSFSSGLHMFSLPFSYPAGDLDSLFGYKGVKLAIWDPVRVTYAITPDTSANAISIGQAYWVRFPLAVDLLQTGAEATGASITIPLKLGWNMIGDPFVYSVPLSAIMFDNGSQTFTVATSGPNPSLGGVVYEYNANAREYAPVNQLDPYQGYWIFAYRDTNMTVPSPIAAQ